MTTVNDLASDALVDLGVLAAGETMNSGDAAYALRSLNRLIGQWRTETLMIFTVTRSLWSITSGVQVYTLGSGATINIPWTKDIDHINFQDTSITPTLELPLNPLDDDGWSRVRQKGLTSGNYPSCWYSDGNYPLQNVSLWPIPQSATLQGVIYAGMPVTEFAAGTTTVNLPPAYERMVVKNLAVELAPSYARTVNDDLAKQAMESKAAVKSVNSKPLDMSIDSGAMSTERRLSYNIYSDQ